VEVGQILWRSNDSRPEQAGRDHWRHVDRRQRAFVKPIPSAATRSDGYDEGCRVTLDGGDVEFDCSATRVAIAGEAGSKPAGREGWRHGDPQRRCPSLEPVEGVVDVA